MIKFTNTETMGFEGAIRGMRNAMNSWSRADSVSVYDFSDDEEIWGVAESYFDEDDIKCFENGHNLEILHKKIDWLVDRSQLEETGCHRFYFGKNDLRLAQNLIKAGGSHRKFLRQIQVSFDIKAPMYFYKQLDTYKISTVRNSTSTMHKITANPITWDCFSFTASDTCKYRESIQSLINTCETLRQRYIETKDKKYWTLLIQILPSGWNQLSTMTMNYETLRAIYFDRKGHKLEEWESFREWIRTLPYAEELICYTGDDVI